MPIYEYVCTACDHRSDILHGINDPVPRFCPSCGREGAMRKLFAPPVIHYKGSGWAKKDRGGSSSRSSSSQGSSTGSGDAATSSDRSAGPSSSGSASESSSGSSSTPPSSGPGD